MNHTPGEITPNSYVVSAIKANATNVDDNNHYSNYKYLNDTDHNTYSKSELDSHANMIVLGNGCFVFESTGKTCNVEPFDPQLGTVQNIPIVDAAIAYDCPFSHETYILIIRNALHIASMNHNLIPPFIMREGGVIVNDVPKIHCDNPNIYDHCISFKDIDLKIPLQLNGIFSYFNSRKPLPSELYNKDKVFITPDASEWNPHCLSYSHN